MDFIILATNTMHLVASKIKEASGLPFLHIAEVTADRLNNDGINVLVPDEDGIGEIHRIINNELILGKIEETSRECFQDIIVSLKQRGAEGVILGCTEISLLIKQEDSILPVYDAALLHVQAAADMR